MASGIDFEGIIGFKITSRNKIIKAAIIKNLFLLTLAMLVILFHN